MTVDRRSGTRRLHRHARLEHLFFQEIDAILRGELADPRIEHVEVTHLDLSPDGRNVRAWVSADEDALAALESAAAFIRTRLVAQLELKRAPELHFVRDPFTVEASCTE